MTDQPPTPPADQVPKPAGQAKALAWQGLANAMVRGLLRTPPFNRIAGNRLVTLYVVGRTSGRRYTVPVAYTKHNGSLLVGTASAWGKNLQANNPIDIRLKGKRRIADVEVLTDELSVVAQYATMIADNRTFASFNGIRIDPKGIANSDDLHQAWRNGARAFRITPR